MRSLQSVAPIQFARLQRGLRVVGGVALGLGVALGCVWSPGSPLALDRADAAMAQDEPDKALQIYAAAERWGWTQTIREHAMFRSALVEATAMDDADAAATALEDFVGVGQSDAMLADAYALLGGVYASSGTDAARAADAFEAAARRAPEDARVASWYAAAASSRELAGDPVGALRDLGHLVSLGGLSGVDGWVGIGRIRFELGDLAGAYDAYQNGLLERPDPNRGQIVRLGMAHALERLGEADAAVAELDEFVGVEDPAFEAARGRMLARVEARRSESD